MGLTLNTLALESNLLCSSQVNACLPLHSQSRNRHFVSETDAVMIIWLLFNWKGVQRRPDNIDMPFIQLANLTLFESIPC